MDANLTVIKVNNDLIGAMEQIIGSEEQEDTQLRQQYGGTFNRLPSGSVNGQYKQSISDYKNKLQQAAVTDQQILTKFDANKQGFALLAKTRQDIASLIPQQQNGQDLSNNTAVVAIKSCLDQLDEINRQKDEVMAAGVALHDNFNPIEELMKVNNKQADKQTVFEEFKQKYTSHF